MPRRSYQIISKRLGVRVVRPVGVKLKLGLLSRRVKRLCKDGVKRNAVFIIVLTNGNLVIVDREDGNSISKHNWYCNCSGYAYRRDKHDGFRQLFMHRIIANTPDELFTDHINGDKLDNRKTNLRVATKKDNQGNRPKYKKDATSRFRGVCWHPAGTGYWKADARFTDETKSKRRKFLGLFKRETDAARAWDVWARAYYGEFAKLNLP